MSTDPPPLGPLLGAKDYSQLIKQLDAQIKSAEQNTQAQLQQLMLNRGYFLQHLGLYRKALQDYNAVLAFSPHHASAWLNKAKVHVALKQMQEAEEALGELLEAASLTTDLATALEAQQLLKAIKEEAVKAGAKLPLLLAAVPPAVPAAAKATAPPAAPAAPAAPATPARPTFVPLSDAAVQTEGPVDSAAAAAPAASSASTAAAAAAGTSAAKPKAKAKPASKGSPFRPPPAASVRAAPPAGPPAAKPAAAAATAAATAAAAAASSSGGSSMDSLARLLVNTDPNTAVGLAVNHVNAGRCREAVELLDVIIAKNPTNVGAFAARGTARALMGLLAEAVEDFSDAIKLEPRYHDFYKRRGQALSASGHDEEAIADLRKAAELCSEIAGQADALSDIAKIYQKQKDHRRAEAELKVSQGDLEEGIASYDAALAKDPDNKDLVLNLGMALKEMSVVERAEKVLRKAIKLSRGGNTAVHAYRLLAQMKQGLGDHMGAVKELNRALTVAEREAQKIELRFLRGACYHALGLHKLAIDDYQDTLDCQQQAGLALETMQFMCLAFYQKEMALYVRKLLDKHVLSFCLDADMGPEFKELWCKKAPPGPSFVEMYRQQMQPQHPNWNAPKPPPPPAELLNPLLEAADALGLLVQYSHQGFLPNKRQQRMAGLAAIEFGQALMKLAADRRAGRPSLAKNSGASVTAKSLDKQGSHPFGWRDTMDIIVRWRQLAEPNDQVIWVDLLTEREFNAGFGSHTPMFTGQTKCVRYYMNFDRALALMRSILDKEGHAFDADNKEVTVDSASKRQAVAAARTAEAMWQALGVDGWVVVPIGSSTREGHSLEGTRLTVVKMGKEAAHLDEDASFTPQLGLANGVPGEAPRATGAVAGAGAEPPKPRPQPDAYEFSIRTPVTPARWKDYDEELSGVFEGLVAALAAGDLPKVADQAMRFAYYWYNFMPLARGSAFCGYVSLLGAFMAAGAPVRSKMPKSYQTDWEAILSTSPSDFISSVSSWMAPPELQQAQQGQRGQGNGSTEAAVGPGEGQAGGELPPAPTQPLGELPAVIEVLDTMRKRLEALNGPDINRV